MKKKLVTVLCLFFILSLVAGAISPAVEQWWANRGVDPGERVLRRLNEYHQAQLDQRVLDVVREERDKPENSGYRPQILYVQWAANQRLHQLDEAQKVQVEFLQMYPDHPLAAHMHFADAMTLLAALNNKAAEETLVMIEEKFPDTAVAVKAKETRAKLREHAKRDE